MNDEERESLVRWKAKVDPDFARLVTRNLAVVKLEKGREVYRQWTNGEISHGTFIRKLNDVLGDGPVKTDQFGGA